jgi:lysozyme family protein
MAFPTFARMAHGYAVLWGELVPEPVHMPELRTLCAGMLSHKPVYQEIAQAVWGAARLWHIVALLDAMEHAPALGLANSHLHNGDSLHGYTHNDPAGRPHVGHGPPFGFTESAIDSLRYEALDKITDWTVERIAYQFEKYNGPGYLDKPIQNPYLASYSNMYAKGKWVADHEYDANAVSKQPGALTILKVLITLDPSIDLSGDATTQEKPVTTTATATTTTASSISIDFATIEGLIEKGLPILQMFYPPIGPFIQPIEQGLKIAVQVKAAIDANNLAAIPFADILGLLKSLDLAAPSPVVPKPAAST